MPTRPDPDLDPRAVADLVTAWRRRFETDPVSVRHVIDVALESQPSLLRTLARFLPDFEDHPHPDVLRRWLSANENRPLVAPDARRYRFVRCGHRWALRHVPDPSVPDPSSADLIVSA